jgi:hypothetical protein
MKKVTLTTDSNILHVLVQQMKPAEPFNILPWIIGSVVICFLALLIILNWHKLKRIVGFIRLKEYKLSLGGFELAGTLEYNAAAQETAWKIYIELVTRVSGNELASDTGILREALSSLYQAFGVLRETLKVAGSDLAKPPSTDQKFTVATVLLKIMNEHLRPFLSKWHPLLQEYEKSCPAGKAQFTHEQEWSRKDDFRTELKALSQGLQQYILALKEIAEGKTS